MTSRKVAIWTVGAMLIGCVMTSTASAQYGTYLDTFDTGYNNGDPIENSAAWYADGGTPAVLTQNGVGVNGSTGLTDGRYIFTWLDHPFDWNQGEFMSVTFRMDFETDDAGHLDDDRVGWMITDSASGSSNIFGVQIDPTDTGYGIEGYYDGVTTEDQRPVFAELPALTANAWYQLEMQVTKLTATSASLNVELWALDGTGARTGANPVAERLVADTSDMSAFGVESPDPKYFTADTLWPAYKNYSAIDGAADNAYADIVPEPATIALLASGGLALLRRKRR